MEIPKPSELIEKVFFINNEDSFNEIALNIFRFQYYNNFVYRQFCEAIKKAPSNVKKISDIPFLPISFFKTHEIKAFVTSPDVIFKSSGTTGVVTSQHYIKEIGIYEQSFKNTFEKFYGAASDYCILGLLPSYLERENSSLVFMVRKLIEESGHHKSGFYLYNHQNLADTLKELDAAGQKTMLIGVTYALMDFAKEFQMKLTNTIVMETGGMKGREKEMVRTEVHAILKKAFGLNTIHSEYGMTELLSQAYSVGEGIFKTPAWMKILIRDETDPVSVHHIDHRPIAGPVNIIDLANIYSCSFIAAEDIGKLYPDGTFEILGRMDNSDIRGCSLMAV